VTGGAGYIGSVVTSQLLAAGHQVVVLDDLSTGHADAVPEGAQWVQGRIQDAGGVLMGSSFDGALHFAAKSVVEESPRQPDLYWDNNVCGTLALLAAMRDAGVPRMVFCSTAATYGEPDVTPITEDVPAVPINPYGQSKLAVDYMLARTCGAYGLAAASLRYFNVGGAPGRYGERHQPETHLIPNLLAVPPGRRPSVEVYGTDYPTPDGTAVRDYLHVVDLGEAHLAALQAASSDPTTPSPSNSDTLAEAQIVESIGEREVGAEHSPGPMGQGTQACGLDHYSSRSLVGQSVVAAQRPVDNLLMAGLDQTSLAHPVEQTVESSATGTPSH